jgi:hypothetical protein
MRMEGQQPETIVTDAPSGGAVTIYSVRYERQ